MSSSSIMSDRGRRKRQASRTPPSRQAEHRAISQIISDVVSELNAFHKKHFQDKLVDFHACSACMDRILEDWEMSKTDISSWKEFLDLTNSKVVDKKVLLSDEFDTLLRLCDRAKDFEVMIPVMRSKLVICVREHVYKYCASFSEDAKPCEISQAEEYEAFVSSNKNDIDEKLDAANQSILQYGNLKTDFYKFVYDGQEHEGLMTDITTRFDDVCKIVKQWIREDAAYPDKLKQEISSCNSQTEKLQDDINALQEKKLSHIKHIEKLQKSRTKLESEYDIHKREKKKSKRRLETLQQKLERHSSEKKKCKENLENSREQRGSMRTRREKDDLDRQIERGERDLELLDAREAAMKRQKSRLKKETKQVSDRTYELKVEVVTIRHKQYELRQDISKIDTEIRSLQKNIDELVHKTHVVKTLREKKLSPACLRKRFFEKQEQAPVEDDKLPEACKFVAHTIGEDWKHLYYHLPFKPGRDSDKRTRDVQILDLIAGRRDNTTEEQAKLSLEKWRWFNRQGDIAQLVKVLRRMHKVDIARKLENKYMLENMYG